jgi:hypothetical protein
MREQPDYFKEAVRNPYHQAILVAGVIAIVAGLWIHTWWPLLLVGIGEVAYLIVVPASPKFRRACDRAAAQEASTQRKVELERVASRLSTAAKSRYDGIQRQRSRILDSMKSLSSSDALGREWELRLDSLCDAALRILVSVDAIRADDRDGRLLQTDVQDLEAETAKLPEGAARAAKLQRLELARKRLAGLGGLKDQREAAVAQLETVEDLLQDLLTKGLSGRDSAAFASRIDALTAQVEAAGESVAALDRAAEGEAELAQLKRS